MLDNFKKILKQPVIISSAIATIFMLGLQKLQVLEPLELRVYDQMLQTRGDGGTDPRLLIVAVTEEDLQKWTWPLPGEVLDRLIGKLEELEPRAIGLDIYRDLPVQPGHEKLLKRLQQSDLIVPVCKHADAKNAGIAPPRGVEPERVGFSDIVEDTDGSIRRNLISVNVAQSEICQSPYSLSWQLSLKYLEVAGIQPQLTAKNELQLRDVVLKPLQSYSGGYENADTQGYQILLNYRSPRQIAQQVTVTDVLSGRVKPDLIKDRIVLIGSTAPSLKDIFNTPYTTGKADDAGRMAGVEIHAQIISQILGAVLNNQRLFWFLPGWGEVLWIGGWSVVGGFLAWRIRHPLGLGLAEGGSLAALFGINYVIFTQAGWFPVISPALSLVVAAGSVLAYSAYQSQQEKEKILQRVQEQKDLIAQLQAYASQNPNRQAQSMTIAPTVYPMGQTIALNTVLKKRYKITDNLGTGGFSNTYIAQDIQRPGSPVCVVKQMRPASQDEQYLSVLRRLFNNEAYILETLGKHPQIPYLLAFFEEDQLFYLVQEFIAGHPLSEELTPGVPRSLADVMSILKEVLQILVFVHSYGVIHRDIKPNNLMRRKADGHIVLIDFGAVKQVQPQMQSEEQENQTIAVGTPAYAPGEQMSGMPRLNSDIYALGIVVIQALTGVNPKVFRRDVNTGVVIIPITSESGEQIWKYWWELADTTEALTKVVDKMVQLDFTQRFQSATEVLNIVESL
ncbi:serine/threonine protein kinase with Chase2 sensor [Nostoc sp. NIES-3756]|uniref:CHASE2 domain-containing serine/threonine-protein kinase n=1 Tax=Nostoc sp. NIES-3756 TaxID=1751286 RepID=UPI00072298E6|nr:CHASE2 domain-containing serine/threonine-protein kinase [Nostoc sp. NIES-3756]BAT56500.1 serine/threonine protein kinase with Chase2 sensor [Nostoc sp. NIES-3756]